MFTDLAVIDWIALVFAAVLLAAAAAAAIIAYVTSSSRPQQRLAHSGRATRPQHAATSRGVAAATTPSEDMSRTLPQPIMMRSEDVLSLQSLDADAKVAARAAKLRRRPVAEQHDGEHKQGALATIVDTAGAHAEKPIPEIPVARTGVATVHFDRTEGFKARSPGFFEDPIGRHELRYWDGQTWTEYVKEHGERFTDPL